MKLIATVAASLVFMAACSPAAITAQPEPSTPVQEVSPQQAPESGVSRTFDEDAAGAPPPGFSFARTGGGPLGQWHVRAEAGAPSGANVLAQLDADRTDDRYPLAVLEAPSASDVRVSVQCRMISGDVDQACGLVARYRDEDNYYITCANALEDNIRLYYVRDGRRQQIGHWRGEVTPNAWHAFRFDVQGDRLRVFWDGQLVIDHRDTTFTEAGRVGLWTKADSVTSFDDLSVEPL